MELITLEDEYIYSDGTPAVILTITREHRLREGETKFPVISLDENGVVSFHDKYGFSHNPQRILEKVISLKEYKVDDPIMVSRDKISWLKRHFSGISREGLPIAFSKGKTSWSSEPYDVVSWNYYRRPTIKEL